jgi:hypothetical protein
MASPDEDVLKGGHLLSDSINIGRLRPYHPVLRLMHLHASLGKQVISPKNNRRISKNPLNSNIWVLSLFKGYLN